MFMPGQIEGSLDTRKILEKYADALEAYGYH